MFIGNYWRWPAFICFVAAFLSFSVNFPEISELTLYYLVFGSLFLYSFSVNPYYCLYFFIVWLPLQTLTLSLLAASEIISHQLIIFLASLKELAIGMLFIALLMKRRILRGKLSLVDYLLLLNVAGILIYAVLPDSFFGMSSDLKIKIYGLRSALVTLVIFLMGRYIPYNIKYIIKSIRLLFGVCFLVLAFGLIELFFIPRADLIAGFVPMGIIKGEDSANLLRSDYSYIVEYSGIYFKRMMSFFLSPLSLAYFSIFPFALVLSALWRSRSKGRRIISHPGLILAIVLLVIFLSGTRAVIAALLLLFFFNGLFTFKRLAIFSMIGFALVMSPIKTVFLDTINLNDPSSQAHAFAYTSGVVSVINHPFGIGLGQAGPTAIFIKGAAGIYGSEEESSVGESLFLSIAMERGVVGLALFLLLVGYIARAGKALGDRSVDNVEAILGKSIFLATVAFLIASIPTEHWLGFQSAAIYWWFAGLVVQLNVQRERSFAASGTGSAPRAGVHSSRHARPHRA